MDETDINLPNQLKNFLNQFLRIMGTLIIVTYTFPSIIFIIIPLAIGKNTQKVLISSGTDEDRAKREPSLCNESVNGHFWSNLCLKCIFKWTWFVKTDIWSVIDRSRVRFPVAAALIIFLFSPIFLFFDSVPLLFHSNFQSWQMRSFPTLDPYIFFTLFLSFWPRYSFAIAVLLVCDFVVRWRC